MIDERRILEAAAAIKRYLATRPNAADTLEGIHHFWIDWGGQTESIAITAEALKLLVTEEFLEQKNIGSRVLWRRKRI
ncbi:hypothetical protein [Undibacterium luofuense]|uniref:hypothetical protein n=1 Tax=Undibacterium luofuense TaxID=2828733 RepID=UPI0030EF7A58